MRHNFRETQCLKEADMRPSRLVPIVLFSALLSAVPFHAARAQAVLAGAAVTCTAPFPVIGDVDSIGAMTFPCAISGGTVHFNDLVANNAYAAFLSAYNALPGKQPCGHTLGGDLATVSSPASPLSPGVYCVAGLSATVGGTLFLSGPSNGIWIFRIGGTSAPAAYLTGTNFNVVMTGGQPCNVYWWVADYATMTDSNFKGNILAGAAISVTGGTFNGNALAHAAVTLVGPGSLTGCGNFTPPPPVNGDKDKDKDKDKDHSDNSDKH